MRHHNRSRQCAFAVITCTTLLLSGYTGSSGAAETPDEQVKRAQELAEQGAVDGAIIELKNALQADPGLLEARWQLGQLYLQTDDGQGAEKEFRRAQVLGAEPAALAIALGEALLLQGAPQRLLDEIEPDMVERREDQAVILRQRGEATLLLGRTQAGCELYEASRALDQGRAATFRGLAQCALFDNDRRAAYVYLNDALALDVADAKTWIALGNLRLSDKQTQGAIEAYSEAIARNPRALDALLYRAQVYLQQEQPEQARADAAQMRAQDPRYFGADYINAQLAYRAGDQGRAREALQRVLARNPGYAPARLMFGALSYEEGQYEQAAELLRAYVAQVPSNLDGRIALAAAYLALGSTEQAQAVIAPALEAGVEDPKLLRIAGEARLQLGETADAIPLLEQAAEQMPDDVMLRTRLASVRLVAGDTTGGIEDLEAASALGTDDPQPEIGLAYQYLERQDYDGALRVLAKLEQKLPDDAGPLNLLGRAYLGKGDRAQARQSFERALALQPTLVSAAVRLAQMDLADNDPAAAKGRYLAVLEHDKGNTAAMVGIAELEQRQGHNDAYVDWLTRAVRVGPTALAPRLLLAWHYADINDLSTALAMAQEAVKARPDNAQALALLGDLQMRTSRTAEALASYKQLVAVAPGSAAAQERLATAALASGDDFAARSALRAALEIEPQNVNLLQSLYALEQRAGDRAAADSIAKQLRGLGIDAATGKAAEGTMRIAIEGASGSPEEVKRAIAAAGPSLAVIEQHRDTVGTDAATADAALQKWLAEHPDARLVQGYLAGSYARRGLTAAAIEQYEALLAQDPNDITALNNLAVLYQQNGDSRALSMARRVYSLAPDNANHADTFGWILLQRGETAEGLQMLEQAARAAPDNAEIGLHLAEALLTVGDTDRARAALDRFGRAKLTPPLDATRQQLFQRLDQPAIGAD